MTSSGLAKITVIVLVAGGLVTGCAPNDWGPLQEYNDVWKGELVFDTGTAVGATWRLFVTRYDEETSGSLYKRVYGALELEGGEVAVAGTGEASHWDTRDISTDLYSPIEGREFVDWTVSDFRPANGSAASREYSEDYDALLSDSGSSTDGARGSISIRVETEEDTMTGIVVETGGPGDVQPIGDEWFQLYPRQIGTATFRRIGPDAGASFPDEYTVRRAPFEYVTEDNGTDGSYLVYLLDQDETQP